MGDGLAAIAAQLSDAQGVASDRFGNIYIADADNHRVRKVSLSGVIQTVAGTGSPGFSGDGGPAAEAKLNAPYGVAVDSTGNLYIADLGNARVRRVAPDGAIATVAGNGQRGSLGDGGRAINAQLISPRNVAVDNQDALYISDFDGHRVRKVAGAGWNPDAVIQTIAGTGVAGAQGEGGSALSADLAYPAGIAVDFAGALYIADSGNRRIRRVLNGVMTTVPLPDVLLGLPTGLAVDGGGALYIADSGGRRVFKRTYAGAVLLLAGRGENTLLATLDSARDIAVDGQGNLFIADGRRVRKLTSFGFATTIAGDGSFGYRGDGGIATSAQLNGPSGVAVDFDGNVYVGDQKNHRVRKISSIGLISTIAGNGTPGSGVEGLSAVNTPLSAPGGVWMDSGSVLWITEYFGNRVRRLLPGGALASVAGTGTAGFNGDGYAVLSQLKTPSQAALDGAGNLYVADSGNHRIRKVTPSGLMTTVAGTGSPGFSGDGGPATAAQISFPECVAFDHAGNLYIADTDNHRIRKVDRDGNISTIAGQTAPFLSFPGGIAVDRDQNIYIADSGNHQILKLSPAGDLTKVAGTGGYGFSGDDGPALAAEFNNPASIAVDGAGNIYVADLNNNRIRKLTLDAPDAAR